jgi:hypothetical protein
MFQQKQEIKKPKKKATKVENLENIYIPYKVKDPEPIDYKDGI